MIGARLGPVRRGGLQHVPAQKIAGDSHEQPDQERDPPARRVEGRLRHGGCKACAHCRAEQDAAGGAARCQRPMTRRRPSGACSTRNTIELVYSPPTERPWTMRKSVSAIGAARPSVAYPGSSPIRNVGIAIAVTENVSAPAPETIADMPDEDPADGPHDIAQREHAEGGKELGDRILMREELAADCSGEIAVDRKIIPLEHVADHAGGDHPACLRRMHLEPPAPTILEQIRL